MNCVERSYRRRSGRLPRPTLYLVATVSVALLLTVSEYTSVLVKVTGSYHQLPPETLLVTNKTEASIAPTLTTLTNIQTPAMMFHGAAMVQEQDNSVCQSSSSATSVVVSSLMPHCQYTSHSASRNGKFRTVGCQGPRDDLLQRNQKSS